MPTQMKLFYQNPKLLGLGRHVVYVLQFQKSYIFGIGIRLGGYTMLIVNNLIESNFNSFKLTLEYRIDKKVKISY
jgi:hypothetical protein